MGYFRLRLVLEHHVLRKMNDGGRCIMSKMEPARGMARAGDTRCRDSHSLAVLIKTHVFLRQESNLAPEILNSDKIDYQKPGADLSIRELGIPNLDKSSQAEQKPSAGTKNEKGVFPRRRGTSECTERRFLEISST